MHGKRILFVITKSGWGGAQAYVAALATTAKAQGAEVSVAVGGTPGLLAKTLTAAGIEVLVAPSLVRDISFGAEVRALKELRAIIREKKPDILHLNSSKAAGLGALAGRLERVPRIICTAHGWPHKEPGSYRRSFFIWWASLVTVLLSHSVIVVSRRDRATILGRFPNVHHIPIGAASFDLMPRTEAREALMPGVKEEAFVLGTIAELTDNKGLEYSIRAFAELKIRGFADRYVIIGEGELRPYLQSLTRELGVANEVVFAGFLPNARTYLSACDLFLLPSLKEGLPYAVLEARRAGLPVVASDVGGIPDALSGSGTLVPPRRPNAIVLAVITHRKQQGRTPTQKPVYTEEEMVAATFALY